MLLSADDALDSGLRGPVSYIIIGTVDHPDYYDGRSWVLLVHHGKVHGDYKQLSSEDGYWREDTGAFGVAHGAGEIHPRSQVPWAAPESIFDGIDNTQYELLLEQ